MHAKPPTARVLKHRSLRRLGDPGRYSAQIMELTLEQIPTLATRFEQLAFDPNAERDIELFGAAFVWSDEKPSFDDLHNTVPITRFFQYLLWYRKSLIQQEPFDPFTKYWDAFQSACPTWPGFRPERCDPNLCDELNPDVDATMNRVERAFDICDRKRNRDQNAE